MPYFQSGKANLYYSLEGLGQHIILLHGFTSSFEADWVETGWVKFLTRHKFEAMGLDFRGHGRSEKFYNWEDYTTPELGHDVINLMDHLDVYVTDVLGYSLGGGIALWLGIHYPDRIRRIVVGGVGDTSISPQHSEAIQNMRAALQQNSLQSVFNPAGRDFRRYIHMRGNDMQALSAYLDGPGWPGGLIATRTLNCPVLFVKAEEDPHMRETEKLKKTFPHAQWQEIPNADHYTVVRDPRFKDTVLEFLNEQT
jgi:pimeloyl-ACP methyl ester carboxylesterase